MKGILRFFCKSPEVMGRNQAVRLMLEKFDKQNREPRRDPKLSVQQEGETPA